jgi:PHD/YefM family antitoxin component YafN of YafNO toxin-antitoxin module
MKLVTVTYRRLYNLGNYENEVIEATADVNEYDPAAVLIELKDWVELQHTELERQRGKVEAIGHAIHDHEYTLSSLKSDIAAMERQWIKAKELLEGMGVELPRLYHEKGVSPDDIPF